MPNNKWFEMQEFERATYFNWIIPMRSCSLPLNETLKTADSITVYHEGILELHFNQSQWCTMGDEALNKVLNENDWLRNVIQEVYKRVDQFLFFLNSLRGKNFQNMSSAELVAFLTEYEKHRTELHYYGVVGTILEFDHELFTKYLQNYVNQQIQRTGAPHEVNKVFSTLTLFHEDTFIRKEEKSLLALSQMVQSHDLLMELFLNSSNDEVLQKLSIIDAKFSALLDKHFFEYCWIFYQYIGPALTKEYFIESIRGLLQQGINDVIAKLSNFSTESASIKREQQALVEELQFDTKHKEIFSLARELSYTKSLRNDSYFFSYFCTEPLLIEFGRRLHLSLSQVRLFMPGEAQKALEGNEDCTDRLNERWRYSVYAVLDRKEQMLAGNQAHELVTKIKETEPVVAPVTEFSGSVAVPGFAKGAVKVILEITDLPKMNPGDILVSNATYPSLVPAMKKAAAIVTDLGGIVSHAAIISRELGIPCVVGTKIATKILKDGDVVEVDADKGTIRKV